MRTPRPSASLMRLTFAAAMLLTIGSRPLAAQVSRAAVPDTNWIRMASGLAYVVLAKGTGPAAHAGQSVTIHEKTTLTNGTVLFDSHAKNTPITFQLGANQVIAGVEQGVTGMQVGERRLLVVPPSLSQRSSYPANTPRDSTLRIDLELVAIPVAKKNP